MKRTIRNNIFETNSSSEHSLTMANSGKVIMLLEDIKEIVEFYSDEDSLYRAIGKLDMVKNYIKQHLEENY